ncbi:carbohydrate-binding protein CenC [Lysobacter sp. TY2-98]|uniref:Ig-like domain-containing protein n=1 Tax=Lysobacter sp. TY2-98 TaxID=2290922 RepID=UPI000E20AA9E|nr:Ig-like domain-containing protein [Lysobacter sp. TY2-98]AXK73429.1 carbohydrate-binding protein CenC [Lysobacter sp. TY2-98]
MTRSALVAALALAVASAASATDFGHPDHYEFDASIAAPFRAQAGRFPIQLHFDYPGAGDRTAAAWTLDVVAPNGQVVASDRGLTKLGGRHVVVPATWNGGLQRGGAAAAGYYTLRLRAVPTVVDAADTRPIAARIDEAFRLFGDETVEQSYDVQVGSVAPARMTARVPLRVGAQSAAAPSQSLVAQAVPATGGLGYTVYYGNLHSQTNHSDGGTPLASCSGAENPQAGTMGPTDAYTMMQNQAHGDFLLTSEHNHMFDGSTGTNASANPTTAINLFKSGLTLASNYRAAHPTFLALYGLEWGVISNGGHLNLLNVDALAEWETNSSGQLIGEVNTPKSDYPALYSTMKSRGWIGMFNHPATSGQFLVNGTPLGYDPNGAQVMVLAEVLNSSAFSTNTTETETGRSSYQGAWNILLERGYKVAPASDQDNHCANWGLSFTNRTGVLLANGATLNTTNFYDALKARRTFATEDRTGQLVLTANGHVMGESFNNSGALTLTANYASTSGQTAQRVQFFEGVPGRNGTVTQLFEGSDTTTITPATGDHFYYAQITQANGLRLWSAPVWVTQGTGGGDTTAPTATASESGTSGTITLSATASDNVGVSKVEFYVDGSLKGSDTTSPYSTTLDSTTLANGSHTLVAKAYDAAGNVGTSSSVAFSVSNTTGDTTAPTVSASESGTSGTITLSASASDNVGVSKVEFYVDGTLKGNDTTSPYSMTLDSTTLTNGSHTLTAKAYDAAGNVGTSTGVGFSVSNSTTATELIKNGGFESGTTSWSATSGDITSSSTYAAHGGTYKLWLNGYGSASTDYGYQTITIPSTATTVTLSFWLRVVSDETTTTTAYDTVKAQLRNSSNTVLTTLATYSNLNKGSTYVQKTFDVSSYRGQTVRVYFEGVEGSQVATSFLIDDISVQSK